MFPANLNNLERGGEYLLFLDTEFTGPRVIAELHLRRCEFNNVGLKGLAVHGCRIQQTRFVNCYLSDTQFRNVDFTGSKFVSCDLRNANFDNCTLEFVTFENCRLNYESILRNLPETKNNLKWHILKCLRLNAVAEGEVSRSNELLFLELAASRQQQWDTFVARGYYKGKAALDRLTALSNWLKLNLSRFLWGYGLKPSRLLACAAMAVLLFALTYYLAPIAFRANLDSQMRRLMFGESRRLTFGESLYLSAVSFSTLGTSDFSPLGACGRAVQALEGILGAGFVGLFAASFFRRRGR